MCAPSRGKVGPCFVVFAKELRGNRAEENGCLFKLSVRRPGAEFISAKGAGKAVDGGLGEGGRVGAVQEGAEFITHDCVGETRGALVLVIREVCVVIDNVVLRWHVACGLGSEAEEAQLVKGGAQVLCRFTEVAALEVVTGNEEV